MGYLRVGLMRGGVVWSWLMSVLLVGLCWGGVVMAAELPDHATVHKLARDYYDTKGEWAGKFTITQILNTRLEKVSPTHLIAHLKYHAEFLQSKQHTSIDQRTFDLVWLNNQWQVIKMGAHQSGRF